MNEVEDMDFIRAYLTFQIVKELGNVWHADIAEKLCLVEPGGIEPPTSCLQSRRSPS